MDKQNLIPNRLIKEKSPYLLQHAYNPVDWYPWGEEAFTEAKKRDVPVFLSIGYYSCHWCHVMEKEVFADNEAAKILNAGFVSIKVDREERPDIDHFYMEVCQSLTGSGGWPLSLFLTPDKKPFFAGTYFPKYDGMQTGFLTLINIIKNAWDTGRGRIYESGDNIIDYIKKPQAKNTDGEPDLSIAFKRIEPYFDKENGGFFSAPKFPTVFVIIFLLWYGKTNPSSNALKMVDFTLLKMAEGGIFDHAGGGFFRYSTDSKWLVPHFEKMLYDNALMLFAYSSASPYNPAYKNVCEKIFKYLIRDMKNPGGGFYASCDADSEGREGKYYLFTPDEIKGVLGREEGEKFCSDYNVTQKGNFEGKNILNRIGKGLINDGSRLEKLLLYREKRVPPGTDDKILTSSNSLLIAALAVSGSILGSESMLTEAENTADFILKNLYINGRLMSSYRNNQAFGKAVLTDYAYFLWGLLELYGVRFSPKYLETAIKVSKDIIRLFDGGEGGFYLSGSDVTDLPLRQKDYYDGAEPSGNAIAALCFLKLYEITGEDTYRTYSDGIIRACVYDMNSNPYAHTAHLCAYMLKEYAVSVKIVSGKDKTLLKALPAYSPFLIASVYGKGYLKPDEELLKNTGEDNETAFICSKKGCLKPVNSSGELIDTLNGFVL